MEVLFETDGGTRVVALAPGAETDALVGFFERVAAELSWQPGDQLRACQDGARHLAVTVGPEMVGGLQVVMGKGNALPSRRVWPEAEIGEATAAHVTILALGKEYRGHPHLFGPLCVELWRWCAAGGAEQIVIEATPPTLRLYRRLGWPLRIIGDLRPHWGEDCYLCAMGVWEVADSLAAKAERARSYRSLVDQAHRARPTGPPIVGPSLTDIASL